MGTTKRALIQLWNHNKRALSHKTHQITLAHKMLVMRSMMALYHKLIMK
ncbi:hypothetical protein COLO4_29140 [Corchorus olitorius]|uniref:Uncharacterized protein n=1 Tax=Corchorus olitorius TaxID=93759 RepID=A0A1R3HG47_9ROSI|nr:hypothetical protein COLO4_29140 [Corchorus olitorius]